MTIINKKIKEIKEAEVWVNVVVEEYRDEFNSLHRKTAWQKLDAPVSLGSVNNPKNKNIIGFKVVDNSGIDINSFKDMLGGLFK